MTYSDLLHKVSFDEIAPYIEKYRSNKDIALFKSHYDMLQQIEPKKKQNSKNEIVISIWPEGNTKDFFHSIYFNVVLCIGMSHEHPATESDIHYFNEIMSWLRYKSKGINIKWDVNYDDSLGKQLRLSAIFYE